MRGFGLRSPISGMVGLGAVGMVVLGTMPGRSTPSQGVIHDGNLHDIHHLTENTIASVDSPRIAFQISDQGIAQRIAQTEEDIIDVATAAGSFQTFVGLLEDLGMAEDLRGYGRFTVFAPTDAAFQSVPPSILEALYADRELMAKVLAYHVVASGTPFSAQDLRSQSSLTTLERSTIELERRRGTQYVNDARIVDADIEASNGIIHAIDQVLIPPDVMDNLSAR